MNKKGLPDIPKAAQDDDLLINITFPNVKEAAVRTLVLLVGKTTTPSVPLCCISYVTLKPLQCTVPSAVP